MGSVSTEFPPQFNLNTENQKELSKQIRATLEEHGCFVFKCENYEPIRNEMLMEMENLFNHKPETKVKKSFDHTYYKSVQIMNRMSLDEEAKAFTDLMWPDGNDKFYQTYSSVNKSFNELAKTIMDIVATSYGLDNEGNTCFPNVKSIFRISKYMPPPEKGEAVVGLIPHTDGVYFSVLCQNEVNALKIKSKDGNWLDVNLENDSFFVLAGEILKVWSNGKIKAPVHKVSISGDKDRYSYMFISLPDDDEVVKPQSELLDDENLARFKPFLFKDYIDVAIKNYSREGFMEEFAGI